MAKLLSDNNSFQVTKLYTGDFAVVWSSKWGESTQSVVVTPEMASMTESQASKIADKLNAALRGTR
jgi:hypothetical protein